MRDDTWLETRLIQMWELLFPEVPKANTVIVKFKGKWKNKFGHIKQLKNKDSEIAINSLFKDPIVPEYIIDLTIAHELIHYMHGFNSPLPKQFKHPHQGNIVGKELKERGFHHLIKKEKEWIQKAWPNLYPKLTN
tara:strand:+ start:5485 stop:5889 length:405 start_codon:yes stop_codon:yes gene_type:complete